MKEYIFPVHDTDWDEFKKHIGFIRTMPELIRCKECDHFAGQPNGYCLLWSDDYLTKYRNADDYCSDAERRGEE